MSYLILDTAFRICLRYPIQLIKIEMNWQYFFEEKDTYK